MIFVVLGNKEDYTCDFTQIEDDEFLTSEGIHLYQKTSAKNEKVIARVFEHITQLVS